MKIRLKQFSLVTCVSNIGLIAIALMTGGCFQRTVGGVTVAQAFPDPRVAKLASAACKGDVNELNTLVASGISADAQGASDGRPLLWAMECHNHIGVRFLLDHGANPNYSYGGHGSAMWIASGEPDAKMLQILVNHSGNIDRRYHDDSPIIRALVLGTDTGYWDNYYLLLNAGVDINQTGRLNRTVAEYAVVLGQTEKIAELLQRGYSHNLQYLMALLVAVNYDKEHDAARLRLIQLLKERGISLEARPNNSFKPKPLRGSA